MSEMKEKTQLPAKRKKPVFQPMIMELLNPSKRSRGGAPPAAASFLSPEAFRERTESSLSVIHRLLQTTKDSDLKEELLTRLESLTADFAAPSSIHAQLEGGTEGYKSLRAACKAGQLAIAQTLLGKGVSCNNDNTNSSNYIERAKPHFTPLGLSVASGRRDLVSLLTKHGALPSRGCIAPCGCILPCLLLAVQHGFVDIAR